MAGKSFRGAGDDDGPSSSRDAAPLIADEDDSQGLHSGPTVVDDKKVEEVLRKLRSLDKDSARPLDRPPGPLTGITQAVVDGAETEPVRIDVHSSQVDMRLTPLDGGAQVQADSEPTRVAVVMNPPPGQRSTAIGRSLSTPEVGQPVTVPADAARGTMFGHSIHLPDISDVPDEVVIEESSGSIAPPVLGGTAGPLQPFPLAEHRPLPPIAPPIERFHLPLDADLHTQLIDPPQRRTAKRVIAMLAGAGIVGLAWMGAMRFLGKPGAGPAGSAAPAATATAPQAATPVAAPAVPSAPAPAAAAPASEPPSAAAAPAAHPGPPPAGEPAAAPVAPAAATEPAAAAESSHSKTPPASTHRHRSSQAHRSGRAASTTEDSSSETKPSRSHGRAAGPEDPDATLPPSE